MDERSNVMGTWHDVRNQNKAGANCFSSGKMSKLATSNLCQAMMLPRSMMHSTLNDKVSLAHYADTSVY